MKWVIVACAIALAGCNKTVAEMSYTERQKLAQELVKRCHSQGVKDGTAEMNTCLGAEAQSETARRERRARRADAILASRPMTTCTPSGNSVVCY